jgi:hypothetical protein
VNIVPGFRKYDDKPFHIFIRDHQQRFYISIRPRGDGTTYIRAGTHFKGKSRWTFAYSKVEWANLEKDTLSSTRTEEAEEEEEEEEPVIDSEEPGTVKPHKDDDDDEPPVTVTSNKRSIFI